MNYGVPGYLHADHLCETAHVVMEAPLGVPLGLGSKTSLGVVDASGGVHLGTARLARCLARVLARCLAGVLARFPGHMVHGVHCIPRPKIFLG